MTVEVSRPPLVPFGPSVDAWCGTCAACPWANIQSSSLEQSIRGRLVIVLIGVAIVVNWRNPTLSLVTVRLGQEAVIGEIIPGRPTLANR